MKPRFVCAVLCCMLMFILGACAPALAPTPTLIPTDTPLPAPTNTPKPTATPTMAPLPTVQPGETRVREKDGMILVKIEAGDFLMGSTDTDNQAKTQEKPQHLVYLEPYWIDLTEVTVAMFEKFVTETSYQTDSDKKGMSIVGADESGYVYAKGANWKYPYGPEKDEAIDNHPVVQVSWNDAMAYCQWVGGRLPTEAEWEKAARGTDGRIYPWGDQPPAGNLANVCDLNISADADMGWCDKTIDDGFPLFAPVGSFPAGASPYGVLDMAGNVFEWVADWYDSVYYTKDPPRDNPTGPAENPYYPNHVLRGGSWLNELFMLRSAFRDGVNPFEASPVIGFRCVVSP